MLTFSWYSVPLSLCEPAHQLVKLLGVEPLPFIFAVDIVPR